MNTSIEDIVIQTQDVSKYFPGVQALKRLNFEVTRGEVHALVGENGAGKSTLMKILMREYQEEEGDVLIDGKSIKDLEIRQVQEMGLNLIHQDLNLVPMFSVAHNICLGQEPVTQLGTIDWKAMKTKSAKFLNEISSRIDLETRVEDLSISEQQVVAIARSLVTKPRFLILDEPTARLDSKATEDLFAFINRAKENGLTVVYISHRLEEIYRICDRITVLRDGQKIITAKVRDLSQAELVKHMIGKEIKQQVPKETASIGDVLLSVDHLYPHKKAEDISFNVKSGEILGIIGSIGSGKSEVVRAIFGADPIKAGEVHVSGHRANIRNPKDALSYGMALIPEERKREGLVGNESIRKNMTMASLGDKFSSWRLWIRQKAEKTAVKKLMGSLKVAAPDSEYETQNLSGGTQQKVVVGRWLLSESNIFIFDEPTKGIDVGGKHEIYRLIIDLAKKGAAIIYIANELSEVQSLSDRILVMYHGRVIKELNSRITNREELLFYVMGGSDYDSKIKNT